jgi:ABC-type phosphate transport system substrate-binding protein
MRNRLMAVFILAAFAAAAAYAADLAVIVHPNNPTKMMTHGDLDKLLRGKTATWANGRPVILVLHDPNSPPMKFVIEKVMGVSVEEGRAALDEASRSKSGASIVFVSSDEEIVKAVEENSAAIGIVDVYSITGGVKVVKIDDKQPFDRGYVLRGRTQ